jgi:glycosyltransferase involved in cell wall biosynthesis
VSGLRVTVDARPLDIEYLRSQGIGRYADGLLSELPQVAAAAGGEGVAFGRRLGVETISARRPPVPERLAELPEQLLVPLDVRRARAGAHHSLSIYRAPVFAGVPSVITVHDVIPLMWPEQYLRTGAVHRLLYRAVRRASRVIAVSERAGQDAVERLRLDPERVTVVHEAAGEHFAPSDPGPARERLRLEGPYLLYVGGLANSDPLKDVDGLIRAFADWRRSEGRPEALVLAGGVGPEGERLRSLAESTGAPIVLPGFVPDEELPALYSGASCLVTATRYEGFGLPALEAIACGTPVAAYEVGALPEVAGPGALLVAEGDPKALFGAVAALCDDAELRRRLSHEGRAHAARFSWRRTAEATWAVYEEAARTGATVVGRR